MFANIGGGRFVDVARALGADVDTDGRGVAVADLDGDGRLDVVMNNKDAAPTVYVNAVRPAGNWARLVLTGTCGNRDAIGARVRLTATIRGAATTLLRQVEAGSSYASQSDFAVHFGLGAATQVDALEVSWPGGRTQRFTAAQLDGLWNRTAMLVEGGDLRLAPQRTPDRNHEARN